MRFFFYPASFYPSFISCRRHPPTRDFLKEPSASVAVNNGNLLQRTLAGSYGKKKKKTHIHTPVFRNCSIDRLISPVPSRSQNKSVFNINECHSMDWLAKLNTFSSLYRAKSRSKFCDRKLNTRTNFDSHSISPCFNSSFKYINVLTILTTKRIIYYLVNHEITSSYKTCNFCKESYLS